LRRYATRGHSSRPIARRAGFGRAGQDRRPSVGAPRGARSMSASPHTRALARC
jgi:hypothetical protein